MTSTGIEDFFDGAGERRPSGSAKLSEVGDVVKGTVVDQFKIPYVKYENRARGIQEVDRDGKGIEQLVIVLQTDQRNWAGVKDVPKDQNKNPLPPEADEGFRAVFVRPWTNIHGAFGEALKAASAKAGRKVKVENGAVVGVRISGLEPTREKSPKSRWYRKGEGLVRRSER